MKVKNTKRVSQLFNNIKKEIESLKDKNEIVSDIKVSVLTDVLMNILSCEEITKKLSKK